MALRRFVAWTAAAVAVIGSSLVGLATGVAGAAPDAASLSSGTPVPSPFSCPTGYDCSENWSGYTESGATFTSVTASIQVPTLQSSPAPAAASYWVGLGGTSKGGPLIQDGVSENVAGTDDCAWWEVVPGPANGYPNTQTCLHNVNPGETVTASVTRNGDGTWTFNMSDPAWKKSVQKTVTVAKSDSEPTAEWVVERPTDVKTHSYDTLPNFGTEQFRNMGATTSASSPTIRPQLMHDGTGTVLTYPGPLANNAFTEFYGPLPTPTPTPTPTPPGPGPAPNPVAPPDSLPAGYWEVGSDGGVFAFGDAAFYGSTGGLTLQRPIVSIAPTPNFAGYWLIGNDGGTFAYGNASYFGSIPALGIAPAGSSGAGRALSAPIVGIVPTPDGGGYLMVGSDGGVFAFGNATYSGSCPAVGGCLGQAVAVLPDATGNGYWVVTDQGYVYAFGDAPYFGGPGPKTLAGSTALNPVVSAVATPDGGGYWILFSDGTVTAFGNATNYGSPTGQVSTQNPAQAIVATSDGLGYWVMAANGAVFSYGDATYQGGMNGMALNASIIAATGW